MMIPEISKFDLIAGTSIVIDGVATVRQLKLSEIRAQGYDEYNKNLSLVALTVEHLKKLLKIEELDDEVSAFDIFTINKDFAEVFVEAINYFTAETFSYSEKHKALVAVKKERNIICKIDRETYPAVRAAIMKTNGLSDPSTEVHKYKSKRAEKIAAKLAKGKEKLEASKRTKADIERDELWNIIGSVAAFSNAYNLVNIWELTIAQLYDQFARINNNYHLGIAIHRWTIWGEDEFDFDPWFDVPGSNKENKK